MYLAVEGRGDWRIKILHFLLPDWPPGEIRDFLKAVITRQLVTTALQGWAHSNEKIWKHKLVEQRILYMVNSLTKDKRQKKRRQARIY